MSDSMREPRCPECVALELRLHEARRLAERLWIAAHRKGEYPKERLPWEPEISPETLLLLGKHREQYGEW